MPRAGAVITKADLTHISFVFAPFWPANPFAQIRAIKAFTAATTASERFSAAVKACAGTRNPYAEKTEKSTLSANIIGGAMAIKAVATERREIIAVVSKSDVVDRQGETLSATALRECARSLNRNLVGVQFNKNHDAAQLVPDASLKAIYYRESDDGSPDDGCLIATISPGATMLAAIKNGTCRGLSWEGQIAYDD